ncbi:MAG: hypothetical protein AB1451_11230 [Nitrospirota bacterium]
MRETLTGTIHGKHIDLEQGSRLPDGSRVSVSVEPLRRVDEEGRRAILALAGVWRDDASLPEIFREIAEERRAHQGRDLSIP